VITEMFTWVNSSKKITPDAIAICVSGREYAIMAIITPEIIVAI
jgi:hypothetical protein